MNPSQARTVAGLRRSTLFSTYDDDELSSLAAATTERRYARHEHIVPSGHDEVLLVNDGVIRLVRTSRDGNQLTLATMGTGELCGLSSSWSACIQGTVMESLSDATSIYSVPRSELQGLIREHPDFALVLIDLAERRLADMYARLEALAFFDVRVRLQHELAGMARTQCGHVVLATHEELAARIGSTQGVVTRALRCLRDDNLISTTPRRPGITVPDPDMLEDGT